MTFLLISRQFSQTFSSFQKLSDFQNYFLKFNPIFPKSKHTMSDINKKLKTTSSVKSREENVKSIAINSKNSCHQNRIVGNRSDPQMTTNNPNYSLDSDINLYNFSSNYSYYQPINQPFYSHRFFQRPNQMSQRRDYHKSGALTEDQIREQVLKLRQMIKTKSIERKDTKEFKFSLMTYNILSQNLLETHSNLYEHCNKSDIIWPKRGQNILKELLESDCDIICLQEVHFQHFEDILMPGLKQNGYNSVFKQRTGDKLDGCAIVYKEKKFSLLNTIKLDLMRKDLSSLLDRDNIALIVELKPKESKVEKKLIVANTHLLYNPKRGDIKLLQIRLLLAEIHKMASISQNDRIFDYNPIILCGDFNSEPNSLLYNFITKGLANFNGHKTGDISGQRTGTGNGYPFQDFHFELMGITSDSRFESTSNTEYEFNEKMSLKHNFKLRSVIFRFEDNYGNKLISTSNYYGSGLVDYIFYDYNKLRLCAFQRLLTAKSLNQIGNIPNSVLGSDHLSLKAIFSII